MGQNKFFNYAVSFLAGLIPEMAVAYFFMKMSNGGWATFWIAYFSIQVFYFIVWLFRTGVSWILYFAFGKREMVESFYQMLVKGKFPNPIHYYIEDGITYFEDVAVDANNEKLDPTVVQLAISVRSQMKTCDGLGQWRMLSQLKMAAKIAIERYLKTFPEGARS